MVLKFKKINIIINFYFLFYLAFLIINSLKITVFNNILAFWNITLKSFVFNFSVNFVSLILFFQIINFNYLCIFIFYILQFMYIIINLLYFDFFKNYLHFGQIISLLNEGINITVYRSFSINFNLLLFLIDIPLLFIIIIHNNKLSKLLILYNKKIRKYGIISLLLLLIPITFTTKSFQSMFNDRYNGISRTVRSYGLLAAICTDFIFNDNLNELKVSLKNIENIENIENKNILLIQVESLSANIITKKFNKNLIMPFLSKLSNNYVYFPYVLSYHKGGATSDCEFSIINSIEPLDNIPAIKNNNYSFPNSFVKKLKEFNYDIIAFHNNQSMFFNRNLAFKGMGYDFFYGINEMNLVEKGWGAEDKDVFNFVLNKLKSLKKDKKIYYHIITMNSHTPFNFVASYYLNDSYSSIPNEIIKNYFNSMSYVDSQLENFINQIPNEIKQKTYIFIYGDHCPGIEVDKTYFEQSSFVENKTYFEFVPLIIITPNNNKYTEKKFVSSFLDFAPTILNCSGIKFKYNSDGENLLNFDNLKNEIPFRKKNYNRENLYKKIKCYGL